MISLSGILTGLSGGLPGLLMGQTGRKKEGTVRECPLPPAPVPRPLSGTVGRSRYYSGLLVLSPRAAQTNLKNGKDLLVVYLGEMCEQDGVDYLLRAIRYYTDNYPGDTQFVLIGGGPDQQRMKAYTAELDVQDSTHFTGRIPDEELWAYLSTADVCVDPDPWTEWSNMSTMNKIIEYMAFGRPIVAFDLTENRLSAEEAAVYVQPNDEVRFARAIRELLESPDKRQAMSAFGRERFLKQLAWDNSEQALLDLYDRLK